MEEGEIVAAMKLVYERMKLVVEPSGAVGLAAALSPQFLQFAKSGGGSGEEKSKRKVCASFFSLSLSLSLYLRV